MKENITHVLSKTNNHGPECWLNKYAAMDMEADKLQSRLLTQSFDKESDWDSSTQMFLSVKEVKEVIVTRPWKYTYISYTLVN